ncbi:MAG: hypothetical protein CM15mP125_0940 [Gammaproteobacteria bacterium]|nr:MAG: hypothetical protein CM15mP125_0940 [Gammaproteobacteria bacterium]
MPLDEEAACAQAISSLALKLNVSNQEAAYGFIYSVVGEAMAAATRTHATERGVIIGDYLSSFWRCWPDPRVLRGRAIGE